MGPTHNYLCVSFLGVCQEKYAALVGNALVAHLQSSKVTIDSMSSRLPDKVQQNVATSSIPIINSSRGLCAGCHDNG